ncbi:DUF3040 domain-containing protein [Streptomyces sp. NPDC058385]|uniref:DUF3040 domain-containing protein n=1 Tax=Streptomyces sp. NPDC058385 TaxID=3346473 RepID=UPI00365ED64A
MPHCDHNPLESLATLMRSNDPRFAHAMAQGHPRRPREYRHTSAWLLLAVGATLFSLGVAFANGLLIASGLVTAGAAGHLFDPQRHHPRQSRPPRA